MTARGEPSGSFRSSPPTHARHLSSPLFVGRTIELRTLAEAMAARPSVVYIEGEAGVGKTRLVHEALQLLPGDPCSASGPSPALVTSCLPLREPFPFGPVLELLRRVADRLPATNKLTPVVGALSPLLPEITDRLPAPLEPLGDLRAEQHRVFRAARELLGAMGEVVAVVEDLHWADEASRELLRFLVSQPPPGLGVVVTYRQEDLPVTGLPLGGPASHAVEMTSAVVRLEPLEPAEIRKLASAILDREDVASDFATTLHERTAGIPLVVEEVLRTHQERQGSVRTDTATLLEHTEVPSILQEAVAERLNKLPPDARGVAQAAAVLRFAATGDQLAAVAELPQARLRDALSQALRGAVLWELGHGQYGFRHALAQQAVYDLLPGPEREHLHHQAVRALEAGHEPLPLQHLAYHCREAGLQREWVSYSEALADHAMGVQDDQAAVDSLQDALKSPILSSTERVRMTVKLGRAALNALSYGRAAELLRGILTDEQLPAGVRGEIRMSLGLLLVNQAGRGTQGRAEIKRAVEELADRPALAARAMSALGMPSMIGAGEDHLRWLERAQRAAAESGDPAVVTAVLANRVSMLAVVGDPAAWEEAGRLPTDPSSVAEGQHVARGYCNLAEAAMRLGHYERAEHYLSLGLPMARQSGNAYIACLARSTVLQLDYALGRWSGLSDRLEELIETMSGLQMVTANCQLVLGQLATSRGEWDVATRYLNEARLASPEIPTVVIASGALARVLLAEDQSEAAAREIEQALAWFRKDDNWIWAAEIVPIAVDTFTSAGRPADAGRLVADFAAGTADKDAPLAFAQAEVAGATHTASEGRLDEAAARFEQAGERLGCLPRPYETAQAAERAARCRLATGGSGTGKEAARLTAALETFVGLGATWDAARCRHTLRAYGVALPQRRGRKGYGGRLSPREREVARLAALDKTNREIADVLFLSPRTVEQHIARVLHKLEVSSRDRLGEALEAGDEAPDH